MSLLTPKYILMEKMSNQSSPATRNNESAKRKRPSRKKPDGSARKKLANPPPLDLPLSDTWYHYHHLMQMFNVKREVIDGYIKSGILISHKWGGTLRINKVYLDWMIDNGKRIFSILVFLFTMQSDCLVEL